MTIANGWAALMCLSLLLTGCRNPMTRSDSGSASTSLTDSDRSDPSEVQLVSGTQTKALTFLDSDALRYGTGPMDKDAPTEFQITASGLRYRILRESSGRKPSGKDTVTVNYRGWLDSGKEFDSSYDSKPISFPLNGVIPGWTEGMQLIGEGGMIELWIPARLGYGAQGSGGSVPPNATLHFIVELLKVQS
ncbi:MAG: FKBP-type peptidyl-prolyl cis-trans isomerase [Planctomycetaceae bacterium]